MKLKLYAMIACLVASAGVAACDEDPTEAGTGEPEAIVTTLSATTRARNTAFTITAYAVDKNLHRIPGALTATPASAAVVVDSTRYVPELSATRIYQKTGATPTPAPAATVTITGQGLSKDLKVIIT